VTKHAATPPPECDADFDGSVSVSETGSTLMSAKAKASHLQRTVSAQSQLAVPWYSSELTLCRCRKRTQRIPNPSKYANLVSRLIPKYERTRCNHAPAHADIPDQSFVPGDQHEINPGGEKIPKQLIPWIRCRRRVYRCEHDSVLG